MKSNDKSSWAIGGGVLCGIGVGFFYLKTNVFFFLGCILLGLGVGIILSSWLSRTFCCCGCCCCNDGNCKCNCKSA